jgi:mRNA interferase MazF
VAFIDARLMRPIHIARLDKSRPVLVLTREPVRPHLNTVTVASITTTIRGLSTEVPLSAENGLATPSGVSCENIATVPKDVLEEQIGILLDRQESVLGAHSTATDDVVRQPSQPGAIRRARAPRGSGG